MKFRNCNLILATLGDQEAFGSPKGFIYTLPAKGKDVQLQLKGETEAKLLPRQGEAVEPQRWPRDGAALGKGWGGWDCSACRAPRAPLVSINPCRMGIRRVEPGSCPWCPVCLIQTHFFITIVKVNICGTQKLSVIRQQVQSSEGRLRQTSRYFSYRKG